MKLEELVQKLDDAYPWPVDKVNAILGANLVETDSNGVATPYVTEERLVYDEGLIVEEVELRVFEKTGEPTRLILDFGDDASCFTLDRVKQTYPVLVITDMPRGRSLEEETNFSTQQSWGRISFGFKERRPDCLSSITFIPKQWDDRERR
ncbi:MAG: hypothetical protein LBS89_03630 [Zoogloeaceae bacterium]|nr:hypothetical protein [Zoogloeaceae bacterium]